MYLREAPSLTLAALGDINSRVETIAMSTDDIVLDPEERTVRLGTNRTVPANEGTLTALGAHLQVPTPFQKRLTDNGDHDLVAHIFNALLQRDRSTVHIRANDEEVLTVRQPSAKVIEPRRIIDVAASVIDPEALVLTFENTPETFGLDVTIPQDFDRGVGGDRKVGDISHAGLRFGQNVKNNLAPWVQPLIYRLVCTNGMEIPDNTLAVDARGNTVEEVLAELEAAAERAFSRVERDMVHFYEMRNEVVANPERYIARLANERGLSDRLTMSLVEAVPGIVPANGGDVTMFDLVNLITNQANNPSITRQGTRRDLQTFGGAVVSVHVDRCNTCQSKLN